MRVKFRTKRTGYKNSYQTSISPSLSQRGSCNKDCGSLKLFLSLCLSVSVAQFNRLYLDYYGSDFDETLELRSGQKSGMTSNEVITKPFFVKF